jgi:hypothetical protein
LYLHIGTAKGDSNSYSTTEYQSKHIHFALLDQLLPGMTYFYICGDEIEKSELSEEFSFKMPNYGQHAGSIALMGDLGQTRRNAFVFEMNVY